LRRSPLPALRDARRHVYDRSAPVQCAAIPRRIGARERLGKGELNARRPPLEIQN
jgi:hypothetical protein